MAGQPEIVRLYTRKDVARFAGVSTGTIKRDVKAGLLEEIRHNKRRRRYHPKAVAAYLAAKYPADSYRHRIILAHAAAGEPESVQR